MGLINESSWPRGWVPSDSAQGELTDPSPGLLRMDNLDVDEKGTLRINKGSTAESNTGYNNINSLFSVYNGKKYRYAYRANGDLIRNWNPAGLNSLKDLDLTIFSGGINSKAYFLNALGHTLITVGSKKYKDRQDVQWPLGIPAPAAPVVTVNASPSITGDLAVAYTSIESSAFAAVGTTGFTITGATATNRAVSQSVSATTFDFTNFGGGTGHDTPDDAFWFNFTIADADQLSYVKIDFCNENPAAATLENYYWREFDFQAPSQATVDARVSAGLGPFQVTSGVATSVRILRSEFTRVGKDQTKDWHNIKAIRVTIATLTGSSCTFDTLTVKGSDTGPLNGDYDYVAVEVRDTGQYLEFSPASSIVSVSGLVNQSAHITRASACNAQVNQIWFFRRSTTTGAFLAVHRETGAEGFTPAAWDDQLSDNDAITSAATNPLFTIEPYRTALPTGIIGMIWFRDRVIYLTPNSFFPSYKLDPGSYDARYTFELAGSSSETCLFISRLDVGTFIVATTKDFYRVTGTFSTLDATIGNTNASTSINAYPLATDGVQILDVNIYPLGITDPAISQSFLEIEGSIVYLSSSGIRTLTNGTSNLINGNLELLFRNESRYGIPPITILPSDGTRACCATSGKRMYWSLQTSAGNYVFVNTITPEGSSYWRLVSESAIASNPQCMCREEDGTILYGSVGLDFIKSMETSASVTRNVRLLTKFNFGQSADTLKEVNSLTLFTNTGGTVMNLIVRGYLADGTQLLRTYQFLSYTEKLVYIDVKKDLADCVAFQIEIYGTTNTFTLNYYLIEFEPRPQLVRRKKLKFVWGTPGRKTITTWPFRINPLGGEVIVRVFRDGTLVDNPSNLQSFFGSQVDTFMWNSSDTTYGYAWEIELVGSKEFEFYEWLQPIISQETPVQVRRIIKPYDAFEKGGRKTLATYPFRINCLGSTISIYVRADGFSFPVQTVTGADVIQVLRWISNNSVLALAWEIELISSTNFEFYGFLTPEITQLCPTPVMRVIMTGTNFGDDARKRLDHIPFRANLLGSTATMLMKMDGAAPTTQSQVTLGDNILTYFWKNLNNTVAVDYELEVYADAGMEFYEFQPATITEKFPKKTYYAIMPYTNFGRANKKKLSTWPFVANTFGSDVSLVIKADGAKVDGTTLNSSDIETLFWYNTFDIAKIDWQLEITAPNGMEFYKFMDPEILQVFPIGKKYDQIGPLDFNKQGLIYGIRLRVITEVSSIQYKVYDADAVILSESLDTSVNLDTPYVIPFPKGVDPSVCRIILSSYGIFYRFSLEFKVMITGHESEARYIKLKDANSNS